jgi:hypothetical protein
LKEQEKKKKQIADYKRKKLEAEEMLANADLGDYDDDDDIIDNRAAAIGHPLQYNPI